MSYISILLPAFHLNTTDISEITKQCSIQFDLSPDKFDVLEIIDKSSKINYGIKFNESHLSLSSIEDLIYQKDCMQTLSEKAFESLQSMSQKLNELINSFKENGNNEEEQSPFFACAIQNEMQNENNINEQYINNSEMEQTLLSKKKKEQRQNIQQNMMMTI